MSAPCFHQVFEAARAIQFRQALRLLVEASDYAERTSHNPWEFALEIRHLFRLGLTENDLRYLVRLKLVDHASELRQLGSPSRQFRPSGELNFTADTCFVLTPIGMPLAKHWLTTSSEHPCPGERTLRVVTENQVGVDSVPSWDAQRHVLVFQDRIVKQFRSCAVNQETILSAFQEEGWPSRIDDPLIPTPLLDAKRRLSDAIKHLNRNQLCRLLLFHGDGTGQGVLWEQLPLSRTSTAG